MIKFIIDLIYKCIYLIESIEYSSNDFDEYDITKKIIEEYSTKGYKVLSDKGYRSITDIFLTQMYTNYELILENDKLICADNHIVFNENLTQVFVKNLKKGDIVKTINGESRVLSLKKKRHKTTMLDITVDSIDHRYYSNNILSHNTICASIYILHYMLFHNTKNVLIAANKLETSQEVLDKIKIIYSNLPFFLQSGIDVWNVNRIKFENGCRAKAFAMSKNASIGNTGDLVYIDEFAHIDNTVANKFYKSIFPTLASIENSKMIITSTPNGFNLFHKLLTDSEREIDDPLKNEFKSLRVYWHQVPGRNVTYFKLNEHKVLQNGLTVDSIYKQLKEKYNPNDEVTSNKIPIVQLKKDSITRKRWIHVQNTEKGVKYEELKNAFVFNSDNEKVFCSQICDGITTWKMDSIKNIGGIDNFNQEYDLRFASGSRSVLREETLERINKQKEEFEFIPKIEEFEKIKWDISALKFIENWNIDTRKNIYGMITVDVSEGLGQDYSIINMFELKYKDLDLIEEQREIISCREDFFQLEQFGLFRSNIISVEQLAEMLYVLVYEFFDPDKFKVVVEYNNDGKTLLSSLKNVFNRENDYSSYPILKFKHRIDSTERSLGLKVGPQKNKYVKDYQSCLEEETFIVHEENTIKEIGTFIAHETKAGNVTYKGDGGNDDCVPGDTLIITDNGVKEIKDINIGDYVLTHRGNFKKVLNASKRYSEDIYRIVSNNKMDLLATENHPMFLIEKINFTNKDRSLRFYEEPKWLSPSDENINIKKHYTAFIPSQTIKDVEYIDLYDYCDHKKNIIKDDKIYSIMYENKNVINPNQNVLDRYIKVDEDFCFILGYYLAEGSVGKHTVSFASHGMEKTIRNFVIKYFKKLGLNPSERKNTQGHNSYNVTFGSVIFRNFFKTFGKSDHKKLPSFCEHLPKEKLKQIINGYLMGDGGFSQYGVKAASISPNIAFSIYGFLIKLGYKPSIKKRKQPKNRGIQYKNAKEYIYMVSLNEYDKLDILNNIDEELLKSKNIRFPNNPSDNKTYQKFHQDYLIGKIRSIKKETFNDYVYNLEVEDDNSYIANGIIVHNCSMTIVNMTQGWKNRNFKDMILDFMQNNKNETIDKLIAEILENEKPIGTDYGSFFKASSNASSYRTGGKINPSSLL